VKDGEIATQRAHGVANIEFKVPMKIEECEIALAASGIPYIANRPASQVKCNRVSIVDQFTPRVLAS
jgi:hypothetical protein